MKIKVWEITKEDAKWYVLYDKQNDYQNNIYNNGYDEVLLPEEYELKESQSGEPLVYRKQGEGAYKIHKGKTGYMLYPAILTVSEAYEQNRIIFI